MVQATGVVQTVPGEERDFDAWQVREIHRTFIVRTLSKAF